MAKTVRLTQIRRTIVAAQGFAGRYRRAAETDVEAAIRRLSAVQLDSISTVDRAHRLTLSSRIGAFDPEDVPQAPPRRADLRVLGARSVAAAGRAVAALPDGDGRAAGHWGWHDRAFREHPELFEPVLERIRAEGPLGSRDFEGSGGGGDMWNWKPAKMVLEALWDSGQLVIAGRRSFQRLYDLTERVIPKHVLETPTPPEDETLRTFALLAVRARGALTEAAIREHWRLKGGKARLHHHLVALVDEGRLREVARRRRRRAVLRRRRARARRRRRAAGARLAVRQHRLGPAAARARLRLPARDRGLQARARARLRLLRPPAARRRPLRRPRRPEVRPRAKACCTSSGSHRSRAHVAISRTSWNAQPTVSRAPSAWSAPRLA